MNRIEIKGIIGKDVTKDSFAAMLAKCDPAQELELVIDSDGGSVLQGMAMVDMIEAWPQKTRAVVSSVAFSMASVLAAACDETSITRNGYLMWHEPRIMPDGEMLTADTLRAQADQLDQFKGSILRIYAGKIKKPIETIAEMLKSGDRYFTSEEAKAFGVVDEVLPVVRPTALALRNRLDEKMVAMLTAIELPKPEPKKMGITPTLLKTKYPKLYALANPAKILAMMEDDSMTEEMAVQTMGGDLAAENEMLKQKLAELEAKLASMQMAPVVVDQAVAAADANKVNCAGSRQPTPVTSVPEIQANGSGKPAMTAEQEWNQRIADIVAQAKVDKVTAVRRANRQYPELRQRVLAETKPAKIV